MASALVVEPVSETAPTPVEILRRYAALPGQGHAEVLGLGPQPSAPELKAAFTALARRFHPDRGTSLEDDVKARLQALFIRISEAYRALQTEAAARRTALVVPRPAERPLAQPPAPRKPAQPAAPEGKGADRIRVERAVAEAEELLASGDAEGAIAILHGVVIREDRLLRPKARLLLARCYSSDPRWKAYAIRLLRELQEETPHDAEALVLQAALYQREGLLARAESTLRRALACDPGSAEARERLRAVTASRRSSSPPPPPPPSRGGLFGRLLSRRV